MGEPGDASERSTSGNLALRLGLAGALGLGALVTGFILTRPGRMLVGDVLAGRSRTPLEGRVLDALWSDRVLGRRGLDVRESASGRVTLQGRVGEGGELDRALAIARRTKGVEAVEAKVVVESGRDAARRVRRTERPHRTD